MVPPDEVPVLEPPPEDEQPAVIAAAVSRLIPAAMRFLVSKRNSFVLGLPLGSHPVCVESVHRPNKHYRFC
jgi:hypothetical protein